MNILLLEEGELRVRLPRADRRWEHIKKVLKKREGEELEAGLVTDSAFGPAPARIGQARIESLDDSGLSFSFSPRRDAPPLCPVRMLIGFPRPIQAKRIFKALTSLGVGEIILTGTELGEKSYLESDFFRKGEYRRSLLEGAEQAGNPRLPRVRSFWTLRSALAAMETPEPRAESEPRWSAGDKLLLHLEPGAPRLGSLEIKPPLSLAIGNERGWTEDEVELIRSAGYLTASLGDRILKTEGACEASLAITLGKLGYL